MGSVNLIRSCLDSISQISDEITDAIVYLDAGCSEAFQSLGAYSLLLELGVLAVCSLENSTALDIAGCLNAASSHPVEKIVCITSCLLSDAHRYILRCLSLLGDISKCTIFTSVSEVAHSGYVDSPLGPDAFREYETLLSQDYEELLKKRNVKGLNEELMPKTDGWSELTSKKKNVSDSDTSFTGRDIVGSRSTTCIEAERWPRLVVSVQHFPMILCALSPRVFVLPSEGTLGEACLSNDNEYSLSAGLPPICTGQASDGDEIPAGATLTADFLYNLASKLDLKLEIFSLGDLANNVGKILTDMSSLYDVGRRNKKTAGLLLIDRSLDLLTPCCHGDSLIDRMLSSLSRRRSTTSPSNVKGAQPTSKQTCVKVERPSLDIRIPFEVVSNSGGSSASSNQQSENMRAFISGWCGSTDAGSLRSEDKNCNSVIEHEFDILTGSLLSIERYFGVNYLEALLERKIKDGALLIKKWLIETVRREKMPLNVKGRLNSVTPSELHSLIALLASKEAALIRNKGIIQLAIAAEIALSEVHSARWDAFTSAENILRIGASDNSQSLSSQIRDLIHTSVSMKSDYEHRNSRTSHSLLSFQDALLLAVVGYILAGENFPTSSNSPFSWEEEHSLKEAIVDAVLEMPTTPNFSFLIGLEGELEAKSKGKSLKVDNENVSSVNDFDDQWGSWGDEESNCNDEHTYGDIQLKLELRDRVDRLFKSLHKLSSLKWKNPTCRELQVASESAFGVDAYSKKGLLNKLLTMVLAKRDIPGLHYHSSAVGRFLKSGLGRFGLGQSKPSLADQSALMVFIVGGINGREVCEAYEAVSESCRPDVELIIGGTTLLTPDDMFELLLGSPSYI